MGNGIKGGGGQNIAVVGSGRFHRKDLTFSSRCEILITKNIQIQKYASTYATALI